MLIVQSFDRILKLVFHLILLLFELFVVINLVL